jgi:hypothetical protein
MGEIPFSIRIEENTIYLTGDLLPGSKTFNKCRKALEGINKQEFFVDASKARIPIGGEQNWTCVANEFLKNCKLRYTPSTLSMLLQYDNQYNHPNSVFIED